MKERMKWRAYTDLAWTEPIVAPPEEYVEETNLFSKVIKEHSKIVSRTLLHLGCGAGGNDFTFKKHFKVTGVDISENMLDIARQLNPEVVYYQGDMRSVELGKCFDAVAVPDSIGYMTTTKELKSAIITGQKHLKQGGVLLIVTNIREEFRENNFVYNGSKGDVEITVFENNHMPDPTGTTYEATLIYLIRRRGKLEVITDCHKIGIFKLQTWLDLLKGVEFDNVSQIRIDHSYDRFLVGESKYPLLMLVCSKDPR